MLLLSREITIRELLKELKGYESFKLVLEGYEDSPIRLMWNRSETQYGEPGTITKTMPNGTVRYKQIYLFIPIKLWDKEIYPYKVLHEMEGFVVPERVLNSWLYGRRVDYWSTIYDAQYWKEVRESWQVEDEMMSD